MNNGSRLGDNDKHYGPFIFSKREKTKKKPSFYIHLSLCSQTKEQGVEEKPLKEVCANYIMLFTSFYGSAAVKLPWLIVKPKLRKVYPESWNEDTVERLGRNWYYDVSDIQYGVSINAEDIHINVGTSSFSEHGKSFIKRWPWIPKFVRSEYLNSADTTSNVERDSVNKRNFLFRDFDGEVMAASVNYWVGYYLRLSGWFTWLGRLLPRKLYYRIEYKFSGEVGRGKGSWKGGTISTSIPTKSVKDPQASFIEYCNKHGMEFLGDLGVTEGDITQEELHLRVAQAFPEYLEAITRKDLAHAEKDT